MSRLTLELFPEVNAFVWLFKDVHNARDLRADLISRSTDYALIDAKKVLHVSHLSAAVTRALFKQKLGVMSSNTLHSEVVFCLSPYHHIADAFRRFGISDQTDTLLVVRVLDSGESLRSTQADILKRVQGQPVDVDQVAKILPLADLKAIKKDYKLSEIELSTNAVDAILSRIAAQDVA